MSFAAVGSLPNIVTTSFAVNFDTKLSLKLYQDEEEEDMEVDAVPGVTVLFF